MPMWPPIPRSIAYKSDRHPVYTSISIHCVVADWSSIESFKLGNERSRASLATLAVSEFVSSESLDDNAMSDGSCGGNGSGNGTCCSTNNLAATRPSRDADDADDDESDGASIFCWQVALYVVRLQEPHGRRRLVSTRTSPLIPVKMTPQHTLFLRNRQNGTSYFRVKFTCCATRSLD